MIRTFIFLFRYKILRDPKNLSHHTHKFFELSKKEQRQIVDKYFRKFTTEKNIASYFQEDHARFYKDNQEITFFHCYYFDKLLITHDVNNLRLIDQFKLPSKKINYLIHYTLEYIKDNNIPLEIDNILTYPDELPTALSQNIEFMEYLIKRNYYNIKYITYNPQFPEKQRSLIREAIKKASLEKFTMKIFLKSDQTLPEVLANNIDFLLYIIKNDLSNINLLNEKILEQLTITNQQLLIKTIISAIELQPSKMKIIENNKDLSLILNQNETFINYILSKDLNYISHIDWHNLNNNTLMNLVDNITNILKQTNQTLNIMKYPFRNLFFQNYHFMNYLMEQDFRWLAVAQVNTTPEMDKLIDLFFQKITSKKYRFKLADFLENSNFINHRLIENKKMLHYFFSNQVPLVQHINFLQLKSTRNVIENLVGELEKTKPEYEFHNEDYLINGKYPKELSNSYRFMRYVIDKNFNHIAYIDTSFLDKREKKRIINYAFRMVYYIRGNNKNLNFDLQEPYFQNSDIIQDDYFQECLKSL